MSGSIRKDHFFTLGIHKVPANVSRKDFEVKVDALMDDLVAVPLARTNFVRFNLMLQNEMLDEHLRAVGLPPPEPCVVITAECEVAERQAEIFRDTEVQNLLAAAKSWGFHIDACISAADIVTRVDLVGNENRKTCMLLSILQVPTDISAVEYQEKLGQVVDKWLALPVFKRNLVKHTMWLQNETMASSIRALNYPAAEPTVVIMTECESPENLIEWVVDPESGKFAAEHMPGFLSNSHIFAVDVVRKV